MQMKLNNNIPFDILMNHLKTPVIKYNAVNKRFWGVAFFPEDNKISLVAASALFVIYIKGLTNIDPKGAYYDYFEDCWKKESSYPISINDLFKRLEDQTVLTHKLIIPYTNMVNIFNRFSEEAYNRECIAKNQRLDPEDFRHDHMFNSRIIITGGTSISKNKAEARVTFGIDKDKRIGATIKKLPYPIVPERDSPINEDYIVPGIEYKVKVTRIEGGYVYVDVLEPYGEARIGVKHFPSGVILGDLEKTNNLDCVPHKNIMYVNFIKALDIKNSLANSDQNRFEYNLTIPPNHLKASIFLDIFKCLNISLPTLVEVLVGPTRMHYDNEGVGKEKSSPIMLQNVQKGSNDLDILIWLHTMNQTTFKGIG